MCHLCKERNAKREQILSRANEIADMAILATSGIDSMTDALKLKLKLDELGEADLLDPQSMLMLIAHFALQSKSLEKDNKRLHETLGYLSTSQKEPQSEPQKAPPIEALRLIEAVVNTFENAQVRAMEGVNAQIRELKNRYGLNKSESAK